MAFGPTNSYEQYDVEGMREDLGPIVFNIDPVDTPFMNSIARGVANQVKHEWQTDTLDTASAASKVVESDDAAFPAITKTIRPHNYLQINAKYLALSGTLQAVTLAGRQGELGYQLARLAKSLKRDCEFALCQEQLIDAGSNAGGDARALSGYETWIQGARGNRTGTEPTHTAGTPSGIGSLDGTQRALQEPMLQSVLQATWTAGGDVNLIIAGPYNKRIISGMAGNSTRFDIGEDQRLTSAISVLISDYGEHRIVASRFSRDRSVLCVDTKYWSMNFLRPFREAPLAKTGDAEKRMMNVEYTLCAYNAASSGIVADLNTTG